MINMLDAERASADFEVVNPEYLMALHNKILELEESLKHIEREVLRVKRAAANGAWCRRNHTSDGY